MHSLQTIETAPKDGTTIAGWSPREPGVLRLVRWGLHLGSPKGGPLWVTITKGLAVSNVPTHWLPVPPLPSNAGVAPCEGAQPSLSTWTDTDEELKRILLANDDVLHNLRQLVRRVAAGVTPCVEPSAPKPMQGLADWLRAVAETQAADTEQEACMRQWAREVDAARGVAPSQPQPALTPREVEILREIRLHAKFDGLNEGWQMTARNLLLGLERFYGDQR